MESRDFTDSGSLYKATQHFQLLICARMAIKTSSRHLHEMLLELNCLINISHSEIIPLQAQKCGKLGIRYHQSQITYSRLLLRK